jgi:zinc transporter 7
VLLAFAAGGLLGDVFLHLLPHATEAAGHGHDHGHGHGHGHGHEGHSHSLADLSIGLYTLVGLLAFFVVEKMVRAWRDDAGAGHSHGHSHSHAHAGQSPIESTVVEEEDTGSRRPGLRKRTPKASTTATVPAKKSTVTASDVAAPTDAPLAVAGYLNLVADFTHNVTDGLSIGATFAISQRLGLVTTLAVFLHEIPHEIGDFAILIQCGFSKRRAMAAQLVTALGALAGTVAATSSADGASSVPDWVLPVTGGGFIYIATVTVLPVLLEPASVLQSLAELTALASGIGLMAAIAVFE